ncbi:MAG: PEP-CTERM sorting domain-containing protein [Phycisphaerales bacterium]
MKYQAYMWVAVSALSGSVGHASAVSVDGDTNFGSIISITADGLLHWEKGSNSVSTGDPIITGVWSGNNQGAGTVQEIGLADIDFDGNGDILTARNVGPDFSGEVTWTERIDATSFGGQPVAFNVSPANSIAMGDLDGDGNGDMILGRNDGYITWVERINNNVTVGGSPPAPALPNVTFNVGGVRSVDNGDRDGDGDGDVVVARTDGLVSWIERAGDALSANFTGTNTSPANTIRIGNLDNDSDGDIVVGRDDGWISWVERSGDNLTGINSFNAGGVNDLAVGDAGNGGGGDVFIARPDGTVLWVRPTRLIRTSVAIATSPLLAGLGASITAIDIGDLNGNGMLDIVVGINDNDFGGSLAWLEVQGTSLVVLDPFFNLGSPVVDLKIGDRAVPSVLVGDLDGDGFVGITDLNIVLGNWNQNVTPGNPLEGDPNGDGFVGIEDLNEVLGNWNAGTPPAQTAVPEPATLLLLGAGVAAGVRRRV